MDALYRKGSGYALMMVTRPQTLGYALTDSPNTLWGRGRMVQQRGGRRMRVFGPDSISMPARHESLWDGTATATAKRD
jgi:hypothetical protein